MIRAHFAMRSMIRWAALSFLPVACTSATTAGDAAAPDVASDARTLDVTAVDDVPKIGPYVDPYACAPASGPLALDEPLDATQTRAGIVRNTNELIGGEGASGRVGHLRIYNNRVRFIVQGRAEPRGDARAVGYDLYGGNLIDADRVRPRGTPGGDLYRETFPLVAYRVGGVDEVAVACDGSNGRPAAIRVVGYDAPTRLLSFLDALAREQEVRIVTHYILRPDSDVIELRTEVQSRYGRSVRNVVTGDFLGFGAALTLFTEASGFGNASTMTGGVGYLAGVSDPGEANRRTSYAIGPAQGTMSVPIVDASGTVGLYAPVGAAAGQSAEFVRYFSVGTGDVTSAVEPLLRARHDPFGTVTGHTTPGALVYAYRDAYTAGGVVRSVARAADDGSYRMALTPGTYALIGVDAGRVRGTPVTVSVRDGAGSTADPMAGPTGTLVLDVSVREGDTTVRAPAKVSLRGMSVETPDRGLGELEGEREEYSLHRAIYTLRGDDRVTVKPGRYHAIVSRGEEFEAVEADVDVPAGGTATLTATLRRTLDTTGYLAADFHQHTVGSIDSPRALCGRVLENVAEGLEYASTTDHDNVTDFGPCTTSLGLTRWFNSTQGNEVSVVGIGHFNAYPLRGSPGDAFAQIGAQYWADLTPQQLFDKVRAEASDPILHISHPRSGSLKGYFVWLGMDPFTQQGREPLAHGFDAIEVNGELGDPAEYLASNDEALRAMARMDATRIQTLHDWFALLNHGQHTCALGNSDTHSRNGGSGWPHNLVRVGTDDPSRTNVDAVRTAIRAQRVVVASGIVLRVRTGGEERMGWQSLVRPATDGTVALDVEAQAPAWVHPRTLSIFENGRPLALVADGRGGFDARLATTAAETRTALDATSPGAMGVVRFRATVRVHPTRDSHYVVVARGDSLSPIGAGDAMGYTNPVYVDTAGDGWTAPSM